MATNNSQNFNETMNVQEQTQTHEVETTNLSGKTTKDVIAKLIEGGAKRINNLVVKNVNTTDNATYTMVSFTINSKIPGFVNNGEGEYVEGMTNVIYSSLYAIVGTLKENPDLAWLANPILKNPKALPLILSGAKLSVVQHRIKAGDAYTNPFSSREDLIPNTYDHDVIINYVVGVELSPVGNRMADKLADAILAKSFADTFA